MKVLTLDPHDWQLQDGMALLADSALPADLRVRHEHVRPGHKRVPPCLYSIQLHMIRFLRLDTGSFLLI